MANCVLNNTFAELNGQKILPIGFLTVQTATPGTIPDNSAYLLYDSVTGALTLQMKINGTAVFADIATLPTGL